MGKRAVLVENLVGAYEVSQRLDMTSEQSFSALWGRYKDRADDPFPAPVFQLARAKVWDWAEVEDWAIRNQRPKRGAAKLAAARAAAGK